MSNSIYAEYKTCKFCSATMAKQKANYCSIACRKHGRKQEMLATCLKNYGVKNPFQSKSVKEKIKQTHIERYGVDNPSHSQLPTT